MIIVFLFVGVLFLVAATKGEDDTRLLIETLKRDFTGPNNFLVWILALGGIYSLGFFKPLAKFSGLFVILILVAIVVRRKDANGDTFIVSFAKQIRSTENE